MSQPAKVQEPSMEEILASIRRIIADDEAKPPVADKPASPAVAAKPEKPAAVAPAAKAPVMNDIPPSAIAPAKAAAAKTPPPPAAPPAKPAPAPVATNSQDDIDAMLAGLDEATSEAEIRTSLPDGEVFELTDEMALP
jgi:cell pole-organizing protein PopZ